MDVLIPFWGWFDGCPHRNTRTAWFDAVEGIALFCCDLYYILSFHYRWMMTAFVSKKSKGWLMETNYNIIRKN